MEFTESLLKQWQIPQEYWASILQLQNSEALLDLPLPDRYLSRILDNCYPRPIEELDHQHEYQLQQPEDLDRFVEGNLSAFLLKLDPEQEKLRDFGKQGPILVKGGPGTGKSTLALYRVQKLLSQGIQPILFTTYTNALVTYSKQLLEQLLQRLPHVAGVKVTTVDAIAYHYYVRTNGKPKFVKEEECLAYLETALQSATIPASNVDEAQDLSPVALRFLLALVPSLQQVYLTTDASQSLYQRGFSWKQIHADLKLTGRTLLLRRNYRNTQQITAACTQILTGTTAGDIECIDQLPSPHVGDCPTLLLVDDPLQEVAAIHDALTSAARQFRLPVHGGAVLCPTTVTGKAIAQQLNRRGLKA